MLTVIAEYLFISITNLKMKNITIVFSLVLLMAIEISCTKTNVQTNTLAGKWNIINDSSSITGQFNGGSNYIGTSDDYYNFTPNGNLFINEGASLYTATFSMVTTNQVKLIYYYVNGASFGPSGAIRGTYNITNLTAHHVTLTTSGLTPEGQALEIINLKK